MTSATEKLTSRSAQPPQRCLRRRLLGASLLSTLAVYTVVGSAGPSSQFVVSGLRQRLWEPGARTPWQSLLSVSSRSQRRTCRVRRHFWQNSMIDVDYNKRLYFKAETLEVLLPRAKPKSKLKAIEVEPVDGRYLDEFIAVGSDLAPGNEVWESIKKQANDQGVRPALDNWKSSARWVCDSRSVEMVLFGDGSFRRLGSRMEVAILESKRVLKSSGRLLFISNGEDDQAIDGRWDEGLQGSMFDRAGFELVSARQGECGLTIGYFRKKNRKPKSRKPKGMGVDPNELNELLLDDDK
eukprot:TRINITY_DN20051_c0_g1_i2.p1 TRINITY_DN20051_c0_g1~~TRINITY_DN20051_c0_g1_i2.p1  ORF type:complete len:296 (+),score=46.47 TRINITY_DN20051_c0_g1_i2:24-911(+)